MNWSSRRFAMMLVLIAILGWVLHAHHKKGKKEAPKSKAAKPAEMVASAKKTAAPIVSPSEAREEEDYFPSDPQQLQKQVQQLLKVGGKEKVSGQLVAMVVPHAGMQYSGKVAAAAYRLLKEKSFDTVVILAPNHNETENAGVVICPSGKLVTPLGKVAVDEDLADALHKESSEFELSGKPFEADHSVEVQLPFLQATLKKFKVLPILMGGRSTERCARLADALEHCLGGKRVLLLATTNLSSGESYEKGKRLDFLVTSAMERCDGETLLNYENDGMVRICGYSPVMTLFYLLKDKGIEQGRVVEYSNSGDVSGNKDERIVGYASVIYAKS